MNDWYSGIYKGCIFSSVIAFIIGFFSQGKVSLGSNIAGFSVLTIGIMMLLLILFNNILRTTQNQSTFQILYTIFLSTGPLILMLGVIAFILYLMITYKNNIITEHVSYSYHSFSNISVILILIQLYIVYKNILNDTFEKTGKISPVTSSIIYLFGVLTAICSIILFIILKYFTTDGFSTINH